MILEFKASNSSFGGVAAAVQRACYAQERRGLVYNNYKCIGRVCHSDGEWLVNQTQTCTWTSTHTHANTHKHNRDSRGFRDQMSEGQSVTLD